VCASEPPQPPEAIKNIIYSEHHLQTACIGGRVGSGKRASNRGEEEERAGDAEPGSGERFRDTVFRKCECSLKV